MCHKIQESGRSAILALVGPCYIVTTNSTCMVLYISVVVCLICVLMLEHICTGEGSNAVCKSVCSAPGSIRAKYFSWW